MSRWTRRRLLAAGAATVGTAAVTLPVAHADAELDLDVEVTGVQWVHAEEESYDQAVEAVGLAVESNASSPVDPVVFLWSRYNWMLQSWALVDGPDRIDPGQRVDLRVETPDPETRLPPGEPAQVTIVDRGSERRAKTTFVTEFERDGQR